MPELSGFEVRQVESQDMEIMRDLLRLFGEVFDQVDTYCDRQPNDQYLERLLNGRQFIALAALKQGTVVGGLAAYELQKFEQARSEIYLYDLVYHPITAGGESPRH